MIIILSNLATMTLCVLFFLRISKKLEKGFSDINKINSDNKKDWQTSRIQELEDELTRSSEENSKLEFKIEGKSREFSLIAAIKDQGVEKFIQGYEKDIDSIDFLEFFDDPIYYDLHKSGPNRFGMDLGYMMIEILIEYEPGCSTGRLCLYLGEKMIADLGFLADNLNDEREIIALKRDCAKYGSKYLKGYAKNK